MDSMAEELVPPPNVRVLANGTWYDNDTHRFVKGGYPSTGIQRGDSKRAHEMNVIRREKAAIASRKAIAAAATLAKDNGVQYTPAAAVGYLAGEAYTSSLANMMDKPREAVDAGKFALRLADLMPVDEKQQQFAVGVQIVLASDVGAWLDNTADKYGTREKIDIIDVVPE
jgi:hypothetical protein